MTVAASVPQSATPSTIPTTNGHTNGHGKHLSTSKQPEYSFATRAIHVGSEHELSSSSAVIPGIELSTTYAQASAGEPHKGFEYTRSLNPTRLALERLLTTLELPSQSTSPSAEPSALSFSSGSAATATVLSGLLGQGGHILSVGDVYGGTSRYMLRVVGPNAGATTTFVAMNGTSNQVTERIEKEIKENTKVIWVETPTNPMLNIVDIPLVAGIAKKHGVTLVVDNTFASPFYQNPISLGADVVIHSITKYINGHSDVLGGAIITPHADLLERFRFLQNAHGAVPSPFDCWLTIRGIKTLSLRMKQHGLNALLLANYLHSLIPSGLVRSVHYPGLNRGSSETPTEKNEREIVWRGLSSQAKDWAQSLGYTRDGENGFPAGGMISFHIATPGKSEGSQEDTSVAEKFLKSLKVFALAESLGGVESLAELPIKMTHAGVEKSRRVELGIDGELVRLSCGIEDGEDLRRDVEQAIRIAVQDA